MSDIFKDNLKRYLADQISIDELEAVTSEICAKDESQKEDLQRVVLELFNRKIIVKSVFDKLYFAISSAQSQDQSNQSDTSPRRQVQRPDDSVQTPSASQTAPPSEQDFTKQKLPFQEVLKRFQQRRSTLRELERSLKEEVTNDRSLIIKYRSIIQKLEHKGVLHHSVCDQLNVVLEDVESSETPPAQTQAPAAPSGGQSPTDSVEQNEPNIDVSAESSLPISEDLASSNKVNENDSSEEDLTAQASPKDQLTDLINEFASHRLSFTAFEERVLQIGEESSDKAEIVEQLTNALVEDKFPQIVFDSLMVHFPELYTPPEPDLLKEPEVEEEQGNVEPVAEGSPIEGAPIEGSEQGAPIDEDSFDDIIGEAPLPDATQDSDLSKSSATQDNVELSSEESDKDQTVLTSAEGDDFTGSFEDLIGEMEDSDNKTDESPESTKKPTSEPIVEQDDIEDSIATSVSEDTTRANEDSASVEDDVDDDDDKTQIKFTPRPTTQAPPKAAEDTSAESDDDDKTQIRIPKAATEPSYNQAPPDDDKTVLRTPGAPVDDDDKTRLNLSASGLENTSITSQTSATSTTHTSTGTSSTWSKPFSESDEVVELKIGMVVNKRFRLLEFIGAGGMGDVYKAQDLRSVEAGDVETELAIKVLNNEFKDHPDSLKALQRETKKTRSLAHPHIVNVFDFDRDEHHVYMTMELMRGDPLNTAIKKHKSGFELSLAKKYVKELSVALEYAHKRGIVHSDLKPGNIFLADGEIKVFDFGIARAASNTIKKEENVDSFDAGSIGALTPSYASPEMLEGAEEADPRDDIYALGCIIYELLTGKHPFVIDGKKVPSNEARDKKLKPPKLNMLKKWQARAVESCLAFNMADRPASIDQFLREFLKENLALTTKQKVFRSVGIACLVGAGIGGYYYYKSYQITEFVGLLENKDDKGLISEAEALLKKDAASQQEIFENPDVEDRLRDYLSDRAKELSRNDKFLEANQLVNLAKRIYKDSVVVDRMANEVIDIQNGRKIELYDLLDKLLNDDTYFAQKYQSISDVWNSIGVIEPDDERLKNTQPVFAFEKLIKNLIEADRYVVAKEVSDYAIEFLRQHRVFDRNISTITRLDSDIQRLQKRSLTIERVNTLIARLDNVEASMTIAELAQFKDAISQLDDLEPNNPRLAEIQAILNSAIGNELDTLTAEYRWDEAEALLDSYAEILLKSDLVARVDTLSENKRGWNDAVTKLKQDIRVRARQAEPKAAESLLPDLQSIGATQQDINEMKDAIAQSWVLNARRLADTQDWVAAEAALASAQQIAASNSVINNIANEVNSLELAKTQYDSNLGEQQSQELQAQRLQRIEDLEASITQIVDSRDFTEQSLSDFIASIDSLNIEEPRNTLTQTAETNLITNLVQAANTAAQTDIQRAINLVRLGEQFFPGNNLLEKSSQDLSTLQATQRQEADRDKFAQLSENLDSILGAELDRDSYDQISNILAEMSRLRGFGQELDKLTVRAASAFVERGMRQLEDLRFEQARDTVRLANTINPTGLNFDDLIGKIDQAETDFEQEQLKLREQSRIDSLQANLMSRINTMDFDRANEIRQELEGIGGMDRDFIEEVQATFVEKYSERAARSALEQQFKDSVDWIAKALQEDNDNSELSRLYDLYDTAVNIVEAAKTNTFVAEQLKSAALVKFNGSQVIADILISSDGAAALDQGDGARVSVPQNTNIDQAQTDIGLDTAIDEIAIEDQSLETPVAQIPITTTPVTRPPATSTTRPRARSATDCTESIAGAGALSSCRDQVTDKGKGPYFVVLPPLNGEIFAISKYEIRVGEYNLYCEETGTCAPIGGNQLLPITNLSISEVQDYVAWMSDVTGYTYRIPTEQEWIYAATGAKGITPKLKNCKVFSGGVLQYGIKIEPINFQRTQTVNDWGVSNYLGNVQELVISSDGYSARGGYYDDSFSECSIETSRRISGSLGNNTGLRLIREL